MHRRDAPVGLVAAVVAHGLGVGQAREGRLDAEPGHLADALDQRLDHLENPLLLRERHLQIDLRELRLAVGAQVLVAEAAHDLEVLVEPAHHQELLEDLRRLRQGVEGAGLHAAGHQVIARALRRGARHEGRLDFQKALRIEELAHGEGNLRAQDDVALHARAAQIHVAVLQADVFADADFLFHGERRRARFVEDPDLRRHHFDFAGGQVGIHGLGRALLHRAFHRDHVFGAHLFGALVNGRIDIFVEDRLGEAFAVAQVDEDHAAVIAPPVDPAHQEDLLARVGGAQLAAGMGAAKVAQKIQCN